MIYAWFLTPQGFGNGLIRIRPEQLVTLEPLARNIMEAGKERFEFAWGGTIIIANHAYIVRLTPWCNHVWEASFSWNKSCPPHMTLPQIPTLELQQWQQSVIDDVLEELADSDEVF